MINCHATRYAYITFPRYYLVCFAAVFNQLRSHSSLPRCSIFSPAVDVRWEHAAKTRFCRNLMSPYFQAVLYNNIVQCTLGVYFLSNAVWANQLFLFQPSVLVAHNGFKFDFPLLYNEINRRKPTLSPEQLEGIFFADSLVHLRQVRCLLFDDSCLAQQHDNN